MCCLLTTIGLLGPRAGIFIWWLIQPVRFNTTFNTFLAPFLGFLFVPWTTLTYVAVAPYGLYGFDWFLIGAAFLLDIFTWTGGAWRHRDRAPDYFYQ
jgi:hypothetical protein